MSGNLDIMTASSNTTAPMGEQAHAGEAQLAALRAELDETDGLLLETLRRRLDVCVRIGHHKKAFGVPMMQPQRIGVVQGRAAAFAARHGISPAFLRSLYELIIQETCRLEEDIIGPTPGA